MRLIFEVILRGFCFWLVITPVLKPLPIRIGELNVNF